MFAEMSFPALDPPRLEMNNFIKRSNRKRIGFRGAAQIGFQVAPDDSRWLLMPPDDSAPLAWPSSEAKKSKNFGIPYFFLNILEYVGIY